MSVDGFNCFTSLLWKKLKYDSGILKALPETLLREILWLSESRL
jgi:hypothetical protein